MKTKIRKLLNQIVKSYGYSLVPTNSISKDLNYKRLNTNFENLCSSYEYLFSQYRGNVDQNTDRAAILKESLGTPPSEAYFIIEGLKRTKEIEGDICEFGVAQGITSQLIANEIKNGDDRVLHLFDSFEGLPKPSANDSLKDDIFNLGNIEAYEGKMSVPEIQVLQRLEKLNYPKSRYIVHKGFIENLISSQKEFPQLVSFAYVDFDFYEPIKTILDFLNGATKKGAVIMVDDYDFFSTGVKIAVDEFVERNKEKYHLVIPPRIFGYFAVLTKTSD